MTTQPPTTAQSGIAFAPQPVVQVRDATGNDVSQSGVSVTVTIASGGGSLIGASTVQTNGSGQAIFANLGVSGLTGSRTLEFNATGLTAATSSAITLTPGPPSQLIITTQPLGTAQSGIAFAPQPVVQVRDASGNDVSQSGVSVTVTIASGGGSLIGASTAQTNGSGQAVFTNLGVSGLIGSRTLEFSATGLTSATSSAITLTPGPPSQLVITTQPPGTAQSGIAFAPQPVVQVRDASGNDVSQSGVSVTATIASGGGSLSGSSTVQTNGSGQAVFTNLGVSGLIGSRTLEFNATGLTAVTSSAIGLTPGGVAFVRIAAHPDSLRIGDSLQFQASALDSAGNLITSRPITWMSTDKQRAPVSDGLLVARGLGSVTISATIDSVVASADIRLYTYVRGQVITADGTNVIGVSVSIPGVGSSSVATDGSFSIRVQEQPASDSITAEFDLSGTSARRFLRSVVSLSVQATHDDLAVILIPSHWTIQNGSYRGQVAAVSMLKAFYRNQNGESFYPAGGFAYGSNAPAHTAWPQSSFPIQAYFDRAASSEPISAADSATFWGLVVQLSAYYGFSILRPVDSKTVDRSRPWVQLWLPTVNYSQASWRWDSIGDITDGSVVFGVGGQLTTDWLVNHELTHLIGGVSHTCLWSSVVHQDNCTTTQGTVSVAPTADDIAYFELKSAVHRLSVLYHTSLGIAEAARGEGPMVP